MYTAIYQYMALIWFGAVSEAIRWYTRIHRVYEGKTGLIYIFPLISLTSLEEFTGRKIKGKKLDEIHWDGFRIL